MHVFNKEKLSKTGYANNTAFFSHKPFLEYIVEFLYKNKNNKKLNILECGTGDGSSSYFSKITKDGKAKVWGVEYLNTPPACWYDNMKKKYENENYKITLEEQGLFVKGTSYYKKIESFYDLIFVDTSNYDNRANWVKESAGRCACVILHDSEHMHRFKPWLLDFVNENFEFVYDTWPTINPGTLFASTVDLECNFQYEGRFNDMPDAKEHKEAPNPLINQ